MSLWLQSFGHLLVFCVLLLVDDGSAVNAPLLSLLFRVDVCWAVAIIRVKVRAALSFPGH